MPRVAAKSNRRRFKPRARIMNPRRRYRQRTTNVNRSLQPIPSRYICKMKYATTISTDGSGQYIFNLNSLYDPDRTSFGHQPLGFDNLALLFNRYRVISCGWRIQMPSTSGGTPILVSTLPSNDASMTFADSSVIQENPRAKYVLQNPGAPSVVLSGKSYLPALMGRTKLQYMSDDLYQSIVTTSPTELGLLYVGAFNGGTGAPFPGIALNVILEFTCEWFDVKHMLQS